MEGRTGIGSRPEHRFFRCLQTLLDSSYLRSARSAYEGANGRWGRGPSLLQRFSEGRGADELVERILEHASIVVKKKPRWGRGSSSFSRGHSTVGHRRASMKVSMRRGRQTDIMFQRPQPVEDPATASPTTFNCLARHRGQGERPELHRLGAASCAHSHKRRLP
jgi:hypothetical protein